MIRIMLRQSDARHLGDAVLEARDDMMKCRAALCPRRRSTVACQYASCHGASKRRSLHAGSMYEDEDLGHEARLGRKPGGPA